jgi:predicted acylesterase/phospholipase RssA
MLNYPCRFSSIVISGGAVKSLSSIGCIKYLEEVDIVKYIRNFLGTSAGSLLCLFMVLGYSSDEIISFLCEQFQQEDIVQLDVDEVFLLFENYGISSGKNLTLFVSNMLQKKHHKQDITFLELAKTTGKNLIICVANLTDQREEYWSVDTEPNMSVGFAIRASCSLPLIFTPVNYKHKIYIDGGIYNNFPIDYFDAMVIRDVIGINITTQITPTNKQNNFFSYLNLVVSTALKQLVKPYKDDYHKNVVTLELHDNAWISLSDMRITVPQKCLEANVLTGYKKMQTKLEMHCQELLKITTENLQKQQGH